MKRGMNLVMSAASFAAERHRDQRRKDAFAAPFINHPLEVARVLAVEGRVDDPEILAAAMLHDIVEDTTDSARQAMLLVRELGRKFGTRVADIVFVLTDDATLHYSRRKLQQIEGAAKLPKDAALVRLADKIANYRDVLSARPLGWDAARTAAYLDWSWEVAQRLKTGNRHLNGIMRELNEQRRGSTNQG